jgi:sialidase-1
MKNILLILFLSIFAIAYSQSGNKSKSEDVIRYHNLFDATMQEGVSCYRIPAIVTAPNGDLLVAIDERVPSCGDLKWSRDINIVVRRSSDNGDTWSEIETVVDYPLGKSASDPSMIVDKVTGEIFLFFNYMDLDIEKDVYYLKVIRSMDNGLSWSSPVDITSQIAKSEWHNDFKFITSGRGIQTRSGKLLHTLVNLDNGLHLFESDDHGNTWSLIDTAIKPANESKVVELSNGSWMINSRIKDGGLRYVHISSDQGKSWISKPDSALIDPGCNASIIRYSSVKEGSDKNRLLFANAKKKEGRENMTVRISYDEGKTWSEGKTIYPGGSAYSSLCVLENGDIGLFFEKDDHKENVFVKFTLDWLTDGNDSFKQPKSDIRTRFFPSEELKPEIIPNKDNVWVFILAGQSNMAGRGIVGAQDTLPSERVLTINKNGELIVAKEPIHFYEPKLRGLDCGLSFAKTLIENIPDNISVLILPAAVGGSKINQWLGDSTYRSVQLLSNFKEKVELGKRFGQIKGVLWHQGEGDANDIGIPVHKDKLSQLFMKFRGYAEDENLPVIIGELSSFSKDNENYSKLNEQIRLYTSSDSNAYVVTTSDLKPKSDMVHFNAEGQRILGKRYANEYLRNCK